MERLQDKTLVMIVGPTTVGKSTLMKKATALNPNFSRVGGFTTRQQRPDDEAGLYRYVNEEHVKSLIATNDVIQYAVHPTTGTVYGSQIIDYPRQYNLLDTLSSVVLSLRELPFKQTVTVSVTTNPETWMEWLLKRYPQPSEERTKRLKEAILSIEWSLAQTSNHHWLVNTAEKLDQTAGRLIEIAAANHSSSQAPAEAVKLLQQARSLL